MPDSRSVVCERCDIVACLVCLLELELVRAVVPRSCDRFGSGVQIVVLEAAKEFIMGRGFKRQ